MTYQRFEELPVWQSAIQLAEGVYALTEAKPFELQRSLSDQIERAAVSVSNNIAEGFERGTTPELLNFIYIDRGSAGEVRSMLCLIERLPRFRNMKSQISDLKSKAENCSRQLSGWAASLQDSPIAGPRRLNTAIRQEAEQKKRAEAFLKKLKTEYNLAPFPSATTNPPE